MSVKIRPSTGTADNDPKPWYRRLGANLWHDWDSIYAVRRCNWSNFTLVALEGEICWHMGTAEIEAALFGVHLRFDYYWPNETREALVEQVKALRLDAPGEPEIIRSGGTPPPE